MDASIILHIVIKDKDETPGGRSGAVSPSAWTSGHEEGNRGTSDYQALLQVRV